MSDAHGTFVSFLSLSFFFYVHPLCLDCWLDTCRPIFVRVDMLAGYILCVQREICVRHDMRTNMMHLFGHTYFSCLSFSNCDQNRKIVSPNYGDKIVASFNKNLLVVCMSACACPCRELFYMQMHMQSESGRARLRASTLHLFARAFM